MRPTTTLSGSFSPLMRLFVAMIACAATLSGCHYTRTEDGWQGTKWGMSVLEVQSIFIGKIKQGPIPVEEIPSAPSGTKLCMQDFDLLGQSWPVFFAFEKDGGLSLVRVASNRNIDSTYVKTLIYELKKKYGNPFYETSSDIMQNLTLWGGDGKKVFAHAIEEHWQVGSTKIDLLSNEYYDGDAGFRIDYSSVDPKADNHL